MKLEVKLYRREVQVPGRAYLLGLESYIQLDVCHCFRIEAMRTGEYPLGSEKKVDPYPKRIKNFLETLTEDPQVIGIGIGFNQVKTILASLGEFFPAHGRPLFYRFHGKEFPLF